LRKEKTKNASRVRDLNLISFKKFDRPAKGLKNDCLVKSSSYYIKELENASGCQASQQKAMNFQQ